MSKPLLENMARIRRAQENHSHPELESGAISYPQTAGLLRAYAYARGDGFDVHAGGSGTSTYAGSGASTDYAPTYTGDPLDLYPRFGWYSAVDANTVGVRSSSALWSSNCGFSIRIVWGHRELESTARAFIGLDGEVTATAIGTALQSGDFSSTDAFGVTKNSGDSVWSWADTTGTTATTLAASPDRVYSLVLDCDPDASTVAASLQDIVSGDEVTTTFTNFPVETLMRWSMCAALNGGTTVSVSLIAVEGITTLLGPL